MSKISELVKLANDPNTSASEEIDLGFIPNWKAQAINQDTQVKLNNVSLKMNVYGIRHAIKEHGNDKEQRQRGQKGITDDDFDLVSVIIQNYDRVEKGHVTSRSKGVVFIKQIKDIEYYVVMCLEKGQRGDNLVFKTMYAKHKKAAV